MQVAKKEDAEMRKVHTEMVNGLLHIAMMAKVMVQMVKVLVKVANKGKVQVHAAQMRKVHSVLVQRAEMPKL